MKENRPIVVISIDCQPEGEQAYNEWYNNVHIPMALKYDGLLKATRYEQLDSASGLKKYLTVFEFRDRQAMKAFPDSPAVAAAKDEMNRRWQGNTPFQIKSRTEYEFLATWEK